MEPRDLARMYAFSRIGLGAAIFLLPGLSASAWVGRDGARPGTPRPPARRPATSGVFGGGSIAVIAGPCSVEGADMLHDTAAAVRESGAVALRGGAFKPRTSPYSFQGL